MNPSEHLTDIQIAAFTACRLPERESREIGSHLLGCVNCRGLLPLPVLDGFWKAVMNEKAYDRLEPFSTDSTIRKFAKLFSKPRSLAWSTGSLVVILSLALLILSTVSKETGVENDVAKSIEIEVPVSWGADQTDSRRIVLPPPPKSDVPHNEPPTVSPVGPQFPNRRDSRSTEDLRTAEGRRAPARRANTNISSTRGAMTKCGIERTFGMQLGSAESNLQLKWETVPNATKYNLYISDDDEILIDEYETDKDTSYILKKTLDPKKSYKWKIVITLEDGKTLSVDARKFSARDLQSNQKVRKSSAKADTRCLMDQ